MHLRVLIKSYFWKAQASNNIQCWVCLAFWRCRLGDRRYTACENCFNYS